MAKSYKVTVFAGTRVVADMTQQVKNATIEASIQLKTVKGGATSATATILAPGPAGANRKIEDVEGWFVNGTAATPPVAIGTPWEAPVGKKNTNWWDGSAKSWSLGSSVSLPDSKYISWSAGTYFKDTVRLKDGIQYRVKASYTSLEPSPESTEWEQVGDLYADYNKYWGNVGFINKITGVRDTTGSYLDYRCTFFIKVDDPTKIVLTAYSGDSNNVALVAFYDVSCRYLGFYNAPGITDNVSNHAIPSGSVPEGTYYMVVTRKVAFKGVIKGGQFDATMGSVKNDDIHKAWFYDVSGHINKYTGDVDTTSGNTYSPGKLLKIVNRKRLIVGGFSGLNNSVALVAFYDKYFRFISAYNAPTAGNVANHLVPEADIPTNAEFIRTTKSRTEPGWIFGADYRYTIEPWEASRLTDRKLIKEVKEQVSKGYLSKYTGLWVDHASYMYSGLYLITDKNNIVIKAGCSGSGQNNIALILFYDERINLIGFYNVAGVTGAVTNVTVPVESVTTGAIYCKITILPSQRDQFGITGVDKVITLDTKETEKIADSYASSKFVQTNAQIISNAGYIHKATGIPTDTTANPASSYRYTFPMLITDRTNCGGSGFSGLNNNAAFASFYGAGGNFLKSVNGPTHGNIASYRIPEEEIPLNAVYVRFTKWFSQESYFFGVSTVFDTNTILKLIDQKSTSSGGGSTVKTERSGRPNPDFDGHIKMKNYLGNDQNIHPKVLYFATPWMGYSYWMAYTPYPNGDTLYENPCMAASLDGKVWETPTGLTNPLEYAPQTTERPLAYNSDTHLVYNPDTALLECWWRSYDPTPSQECIKRRTSANGRDWNATEIIIDWTVSTKVSPAIIYEDSKYKYWVCDSVTGKVYYRESAGTTPTNFSPPVEVPIDFDSGNLFAWHMDVIHTAKGYEFAIQCWEKDPGNNQNNNQCDLYYVIQTGNTFTKPKAIVYRGDQPSDRDYYGIYRSSILYVPTPRTGGIYSIYYTGIGNNFSFRALYLTKGRDINNLRGVNL